MGIWVTNFLFYFGVRKAVTGCLLFWGPRVLNSATARLKNTRRGCENRPIPTRSSFTLVARRAMGTPLKNRPRCSRSFAASSPPAGFSSRLWWRAAPCGTPLQSRVCNGVDPSPVDQSPNGKHAPLPRLPILLQHRPDFQIHPPVIHPLRLAKHAFMREPQPARDGATP